MSTFQALVCLLFGTLAVLSLSEVAPAALQQPLLWGSLLALLVLWGPGGWSLDRWLTPRLKRWARVAE